MRKFLILSVLAALMIASPAISADISGSWQLEMAGPAGPETCTFQLELEGESLVINGEHSSFGAYEGSGTLTGDSVHMVFPFDVNGTPVNFVFDGTVSGGSMEGTKAYYPQTGDDAGKGPVVMEGISDAWTAVKQ